MQLVGRVLRVQNGTHSSEAARSDSLSTVREREREWFVPSKGDTIRRGSFSRYQVRGLV